MRKQSQQQRKSFRDKAAPQKPARDDGPREWFAVILLTGAVCVVYMSALHAPFIFDDKLSIVDNESIRQIWPLIGENGRPGPLNPGPDLPTSPRPLVNLTLAINYFFGVANPFGYHVFSVLLHILTAILLWALVRRTLLLPYFEDRFNRSAGWLALAVSMLWALHPLGTEAVMYATQRSEQMMAFFYLATLYCSLGYWLTFQPGEDSAPSVQRSGHRIMWLGLAIAACLAGMASKEVMVSAPLMVLLFERTFVAGSLKNALRRSWPLYSGLALTWVVLLVVSLRAPYGTAAGFGVGVPAQHYWLTQTKIFLMYLKLTLWPWPLLIHYEWPYFETFAESWMFVLPVLVLGLATIVLLWRNHPIGYLGTFIFAILAPTSLIPIRLEMAAERRMYLPLAVVMILTIIGGYWLAEMARVRSSSGRNVSKTSHSWAVTSVLVVFLALAFTGASFKRATTYNSELTLWKEVSQHQPNNAVAHNTLGLILKNAGRLEEAISELRAILSIKPDYFLAWNNLGNTLLAANRLPEAVETLQTAVRLDPNAFQANNNLGVALMRMGRLPEAIDQLQRVRRLNPNNQEVRVNLGSALSNSGRDEDAIREYEAVLAAEPDNVFGLIYMSISLARTGRFPEAIEHVQHALRLQPQNPDAHTSLGVCYLNTGRPLLAMQQFEIALQQNPNDVNAQLHYGKLLSSNGRAKEAIGHFQHLLRLQPNLADAYSSLGAALQKADQPQEAIEPYRAALRLAPSAPSYARLAEAYRLAKRPQEAIETAQQAIKFAESNQHPETAAQVEEWLQQYRAELQRESTAPPAKP